jgi:hypothetical protein
MNRPLLKPLTAIRLVIRKKPSKRIFLFSGAIYGLLYLFAIGDLSLQGSADSFALRVAPEPFPLLFKPILPFYFEAIALIELPFLIVLVSPLNLLLASLLSLLVGLNLAFSYLAFTQPKVCYGKPTAGILTSLPALLAGSACCGPLILIVFGIQASASLIAFFGWLIPIAALLLMGTLIFNGYRVNLSYLEKI